MCYFFRIEPKEMEEMFKAVVGQSKEAILKQRWYILVLAIGLSTLFGIILLILLIVYFRKLCCKPKQPPKQLDLNESDESENNETSKANKEIEKNENDSKIEAIESVVAVKNMPSSSNNGNESLDVSNFESNNNLNSEDLESSCFDYSGSKLTDSTRSTLGDANNYSTRKYVNMKSKDTQIENIDMNLSDEMIVYDEFVNEKMAKNLEMTSERLSPKNSNNYHQNCSSSSSAVKTAKCASNCVRKKLTSLNTNFKNLKKS